MWWCWEVGMWYTGAGVSASRAYHYGDAMMYQQRKLKRAGRFALINNPPQRTVIVCHGIATSNCGRYHISLRFPYLNHQNNCRTSTT